MEPIRLEYVLTERRYWHAANSASPAAKYFLSTIFALGVWSLYAGRYEYLKHPAIPVRIVIGLLCIVPIIAMILNAIYETRRSVRSKPIMRWEITDLELKCETKGASAQCQWQLIDKVREDKSYFWLYRDSRRFIWLPKSAFASATDLQRFRDLVNEKVPAKRS